MTASGATWRNWGRTEAVRPVRVERPATGGAVQRAVTAAAASGLAVKPVGSGHSFTGIAVAPGVQLDLTDLTGVIDADAATGRVTLAAGTRLHQLPDLLASYGLALANMGDIDRQTVAGATSTGTHGTGLAFGGLATQIVATKLVTGTGELLTVSQTERPDLLRGLDNFHRDAAEIILAPATRRAFDMNQEPTPLRERYGRNKLGQRLLLARRLVEAGVRFVTISEPTGWDTHADNFNRMRRQLPVTDAAVSALIEDLHVRGRLQDTLVMMFGEFGRTPKINNQAGRDHWPQAMSIMLAGGGVPGGLIYGTTDRNGAFVTSHSHSPADFACTVYSLLGIDPHQHYPAPNGQPTPIVRDGEPIRAIAG